jgi:O-antigen ligase
MRFLTYSICIILLVVLSAPLWIPYTEAIQNKMEYAEEQGSLTATREVKWKARLKEFKESPILGCGFASVKEESAGAGGVVEPGNGWLFVLSSMGGIAFLILIVEFLKTLYLSYKENNADTYLLSSILVFLGIHMNAEGYSLSSGSFLFFYFWLTFGYTFNAVGKNKRILNKKS